MVNRLTSFVVAPEYGTCPRSRTARRSGPAAPLVRPAARRYAPLCGGWAAGGRSRCGRRRGAQYLNTRKLRGTADYFVETTISYPRLRDGRDERAVASRMRSSPHQKRCPSPARPFRKPLTISNQRCARWRRIAGMADHRRAAEALKPLLAGVGGHVTLATQQIATSFTSPGPSPLIAARMSATRSCRRGHEVDINTRTANRLAARFCWY